MQASKNTFKKTNQLIVKLEQFLGTVVKEQDDRFPSIPVIFPDSGKRGRSSSPISHPLRLSARTKGAISPCSHMSKVIRLPGLQQFCLS